MYVIKSKLIGGITSSFDGPISILDLSIGRGGDVKKYKNYSFLFGLDISSNIITDNSSMAFSEFFRASTCWVTKVDLKVNRMSKQGIRRIATVLEKCNHRNFGNIALNKDGIVEAKDRPKSAAAAAATNSLTTQNKGKDDDNSEEKTEGEKITKTAPFLTYKHVILTVDIRYNTVSPPGTDVPPPCAFVETTKDITTTENAKVRPLTEIGRAHV